MHKDTQKMYLIAEGPEKSEESESEENAFCDHKYLATRLWSHLLSRISARMNLGPTSIVFLG